MIRERFSKAADPFAADFVASVRDDENLLPHEIEGSRAHAKMLRKVGLLTAPELKKILHALDKIAKRNRKLRVDHEDVHMNVESWLTELAGPAGAKIHAGRSRNDQVALDLRLYVRAGIKDLLKGLAALRKAIVRKAAACGDALSPGYTHLQRAQPVLFSHILLSFHEMIARDEERLADALKRVEVSPLGAGALAGTSLPIDPKASARALGFKKVFANSIDAVSDRDFAVEFVSAAAILMSHLSQIAENLILWSSTEFSFIELPDELCTSSSIMPQKKNPDMIELVRGKAGRVYGALMNLLTTVKALPTGYNRDLQETKPPVFDAVQTARACVRAIELAIERMQVNEDVLRDAADDPQMLATDLAEDLVLQGVPFREAHRIVARMMREGVPVRVLSPETSVRNRRSPGGTGNGPVRRRIASLSRSF